MSPEYQGAAYYKCALQVNPYSYAKYQGQQELPEDDYNQKILKECLENGIKVVGLADHGKVEDSESLRNALKSGGIVVFPGFEISSSEGIHMVCLYSEDTTAATLNQFLGQVMGENVGKLNETPTQNSSISCEEIAKMIIQEQQGFWYAAHMTGKSGLLRMTRDGDNLHHLWRQHEIVRAGQIPGKIEDLPKDKENTKKYRDIIENKNPDYQRDKPIVVINAKDIVMPDDLSDNFASCQIKMTEPNFEAFRLAFNDPESRVRPNSNVKVKEYAVIESIEWQGAGFFREAGVAWSPNLNAVIGGRGTGKSTLIESIRYAMGLPHNVHSSDSRSLDNMLKQNLGNAKVILKIKSIDQSGQVYTISRRHGEQPVVLNEDGDLSNLKPCDILPDIDLLGQNEILAIEQSEEAKHNLINRFLPDRSTLDEQIYEIKGRLVANREKLIRASQDLSDLQYDISQGPALVEQKKQFEKMGIAEKLQAVSLLQREGVIKGGIDQQLQSIQSWVDQYQDVFDLEFISDEAIEGLPNKDVLTEAKALLNNLKATLDNLVGKALEAMSSTDENYGKIKQGLETRSGKIRDELNHAINEIPEQAGKTGAQLAQSYKDIIQKSTRIESRSKELKRHESLVSALESERSVLLNEYRDAAFARFSAMDKAAMKLNDNDLKGKVRINISNRSNKDGLKEFLLGIEGIGSAKATWLDKPDIEIDLVGEWSEWVKKDSYQKFMEKYAIPEGTAKRICSMHLEQRLSMEEIELMDTVDIELNVAHQGQPEHYVSLGELSTGQKCTAILNLLLINRGGPLIIDQPEDNLDNAFIAERIVSDIRNFKSDRQFIFTTHNANIPVLGDAELIAVLYGDKSGGQVEFLGSIDKPQVQEVAANILEGGRQAFNERKDKYGF